MSMPYSSTVPFLLHNNLQTQYHNSFVQSQSLKQDQNYNLRFHQPPHIQKTRPDSTLLNNSKKIQRDSVDTVFCFSDSQRPSYCKENNYLKLASNIDNEYRLKNQNSSNNFQSTKNNMFSQRSQSCENNESNNKQLQYPNQVISSSQIEKQQYLMQPQQQQHFYQPQQQSNNDFQKSSCNNAYHFSFFTPPIIHKNQINSFILPNDHHQQHKQQYQQQKKQQPQKQQQQQEYQHQHKQQQQSQLLFRQLNKPFSNKKGNKLLSYLDPLKKKQEGISTSSQKQLFQFLSKDLKNPTSQSDLISQNRVPFFSQTTEAFPNDNFSSISKKLRLQKQQKSLSTTSIRSPNKLISFIPRQEEYLNSHKEQQKVFNINTTPQIIHKNQDENIFGAIKQNQIDYNQAISQSSNSIKLNYLPYSFSRDASLTNNHQTSSEKQATTQAFQHPLSNRNNDRIIHQFNIENHQKLYENEEMIQGCKQNIAFSPGQTVQMTPQILEIFKPKMQESCAIEGEISPIASSIDMPSVKAKLKNNNIQQKSQDEFKLIEYNPQTNIQRVCSVDNIKKNNEMINSYNYIITFPHQTEKQKREYKNTPSIDIQGRGISLKQNDYLNQSTLQKEYQLQQHQKEIQGRQSNHLVDHIHQRQKSQQENKYPELLLIGQSAAHGQQQQLTKDTNKSNVNSIVYITPKNSNNLTNGQDQIQIIQLNSKQEAINSQINSEDVKDSEKQISFKNENSTKVSCEDSQLGSSDKLTNFEFLKILGKGVFGRVFLVKDRNNKGVYAMKVIDKKIIKSKAMEPQLERELQIHKHIGNHSNILECLGSFEDAFYYYLLMEFVADGTISQLLSFQPNKIIEENHSSQIIKQILQGVQYLHYKNIIHRDLKLENILISNGVVKLCDFGCAVYGKKNQGSQRRSFCGTIDYISPEMIEDQVYDKEIDIWAVGVIAYELSGGYPPFTQSNDQDTYSAITKGVLKYPINFSPDLCDFLSKALVVNRHKRATAENLLNHAWIINKQS